MILFHFSLSSLIYIEPFLTRVELNINSFSHRKKYRKKIFARRKKWNVKEWKKRQKKKFYGNDGKGCWRVWRRGYQEMKKQNFFNFFSIAKKCSNKEWNCICSWFETKYGKKSGWNKMKLWHFNVLFEVEFNLNCVIKNWFCI